MTLCINHPGRIMLIVFLLLSPRILLAEGYAAGGKPTGVIRGVVTDPRGAPLPHASVFIESNSRGALTDESGAFSITGLPDGAYAVTVSMLGFRIERRSVVISPDVREVTVNISLTDVPIGFGEVVVTATKEEKRLDRIPAAITAVPEEALQNFVVRQRTDLTALAPNTLVGETGSHMTDLINIRGMFPSTPFGATTMFYYDGVPVYGYGMNPMNLYDIERIEILRGPQGTLYGRNALAGVVNVVPVKPGNVARFSLETGYGDYADAHATLGGSMPVTDDLFARVSGFLAHRDGFYTNTFLNRNAGGSDAWGGAAHLRYFPGETFNAEVYVNVERLDESVWPYGPTPADALAHPYTFENDVDSRIKKTTLMGALKLNSRLGIVDVHSITTYQGITGFDWRYDADFSKYDVISFHETSPERLITEELRFESYMPESAFSWRLGLFFSDGRNEHEYSAILGKVWAQSAGIPISPLESRTTGLSTGSSAAVFAQAGWTINEHVSLSVGARYEHGKNSVDTRTAYEYQGGPVPIPAPPFNTVELNNRTRSEDFVSPAFSLTYLLDEYNTVYASATRGFHGGGFNSGANKTVPSYGPENTWNYEAGWKTRMFEDHLRANVTGFFIDWRNQQLLVIGDLSSPLQTITNAGHTTSKGLELELHVLPLRGLTLSLNAGLLDATLQEYTFHAQKNGRDTVYDYSDNTLPYSPSASSLASVSYEMPVSLLGMDGRWYVVFSHQFTGAYWMSHMNIYRTPDRQLLAAKIGFATRNVEVYAWGKNLADHRYVMGVYEYRGGSSTYLGAPRTAGLTLRVTL